MVTTTNPKKDVFTKHDGCEDHLGVVMQWCCGTVVRSFDLAGRTVGGGGRVRSQIETRHWSVMTRDRGLD